MSKQQREYDKKSDSRKKLKKCESESFIENALKSLIQHFMCEMKIKSSSNKNDDYGNHNKTLNFSHLVCHEANPINHNSNSKTLGVDRLANWAERGDGLLPNGSKILPDSSCSFGLVKDKECRDPHKAYGQPCSKSNRPPERLQFLVNLKEALSNKRRSRLTTGIKGINSSDNVFSTMRINIVKGANTVAHTDVLRSSLLPNYFVQYSPYPQKDSCNFQLELKNWPLFKTSIVSWNNKLLIPFEYNQGQNDEVFDYANGTGGYLKMIGLDGGNAPKWFILSPAELDNLSPFEKLSKGEAVAGIKGDKVYILRNNEYQIYESWEQVPMVSLNEIFTNAGNLDDDKVPRQMNTSFKKFGVLYRFNGWEQIHYVDPSSTDLNAIRLHIFFRNVRTIGVCQHAKAGSGNVEVIE